MVIKPQQQLLQKIKISQTLVGMMKRTTKKKNLKNYLTKMMMMKKTGNFKKVQMMNKNQEESFKETLREKDKRTKGKRKMITLMRK